MVPEWERFKNLDSRLRGNDKKEAGMTEKGAQPCAPAKKE